MSLQMQCAIISGVTAIVTAAITHFALNWLFP